MERQHPPDLAATREERTKNASSIADIPLAEFPDIDARRELINRAIDGHDVYAYIPVGLERHVVWVRQAHPSIEARFKPMEWARLWREGKQPAQRPEGGAA